MKIKLSKKNWEEMGRKAGWIKQAEVSLSGISENVVPVEQLIGTEMKGMTANQIDEAMHGKGYFLFREHYPWGKTLSYRNISGDKIYYERNDSGKMVWMNGDQFRDQLRKDWRPPDREGQDWFVINLGPNSKW